MGIKVKRKSSKSATDLLIPDVDSTAEPPLKKQKIVTGADILKSLRGPNASEGLKQWLYLISNKHEQAQMDKELSSVEVKEAKDTHIDTNPEGNEESAVTSVKEGDEDDLVLDSKSDHDAEQEKSVEHIDAFLQAGGSPSDIVYTLPLPENAKVSQLRHVFRALSKVLLRISADYHEKIPEAVDVCRDLISSYSKHINDMLKIQRAPRERVLNLELLTAMVSLDSRFAKEILNTILLEAETVEQLTSLRGSIYARIAYLKFLVALLIDADNSLIMAVVHKPWLLTSVMENLQYDPSDIVVLLLMTLKKTVVDNKTVPKSAKQIIFNTDSIISLLYLYKWKGPQNRPRSLTFWAMKKMADKPKLEAEVDSTEAQHVTNAVHELLIVLLTDHRYGIIFRDTSVAHHSDRHNKMVSRVLQRIGHPWENPKVSQLISKILAACPDSLRSMLTSIEPFIEPRSSSKWFHCVGFLKQVLQDQCPVEILERQLSWLTMAHFGAAVIEMCVPVSVVRALSLNNAAALYSTDAAVAKCTLDLLVCMLRKTNGFLEAVRQWVANGVLSHAQSTSFRRHLTDSLLKHVPNLDSVQKAWQLWSDKYLESDNDDIPESEKPLDILSLLLELMEMYQRLCPAALDPLRSSQSHLKSLMTATVLKAVGSEATAQLRNRLYQLLLAINDQSFNVENSEMQESICLMFNDLLSASLTVRNLAWSVLQSLIRRTGSLEGSPQEAVVWLSVFQETFIGREETSEEAATIIVVSMVRASTLCSKYLDILAHSEEEVAGIIKDDGISSSALFDSAAFLELLEDSSENQNLQQLSSYPMQFNVATLSPWLPAFLEVLSEYVHQKKLKRRSKKTIEEFCSKLIMRLLHRLPHPGSLLHFILSLYSDVVPSELLEHLKSWLPGGDPRPVEAKLLGESSLEAKLSSFFFFEQESISDSNEIQKLFLNLALPSTEANLKDIPEGKRYEAMTQVLQVVYFFCFHLSQLAQLNKLTEEHVQKSQEVLHHILEIASHFDELRGKGKEQGLVFECIKAIFAHPVFLQQFNPLAKHISDSSLLLTRLIIGLAKTSSSYCALDNMLAPYKDKLFSTIKVAAKKKRNPKGDSVLIVDAFPLKFQEMSELLNIITDLPSSSAIVGSDENLKLSQWWYLTAHLIARVSDLRKKGNTNAEDMMILQPPTVSHVSKWVLQLLPSEHIDSHSLIQALLDYISSCPQQTAHIPDLLLPELLISKQVSVAGFKLAEQLALFSKSKNLITALESALKDKASISKRLSVILPVLRVALEREEKDGVKKSILMSLYGHIKSKVHDSILSLTDHPEWLPLNADVVVLLMKKFMKIDSRDIICKALEKKAPVLTQDKLYYLKLITEVFHTRPPQLLMLLLAWLGVSLKKHGHSGDQAPLIQSLCHAILLSVKKEQQEEYSSVKESKVWQETLRLALKFGLSSVNILEGDEEVENCEIGPKDISSLLIQTLTILFDCIYCPEEEHEHISMTHNMTVQHSEFINIMMGSSSTKFELVQFLYVLLKGRANIMDSTHVPVLLAAYNATLSGTDRALLRLLMLYEKYGVDLSHCRPYFWGRQGANHYSIWSHSSKGSKALWQQPRPDQVLELLEVRMVLETISKFPMQSTLNVEEDKSEPVEGVYDPSFCLPLFIYLLSPESPVLTHMFVRSGALAITLASLSSFDEAVRAAAYTTLSRFVSHLQMARGRNKDLLLQLMSTLQKGISAIGDKSPRLPSVVTVFLARSVLELANPLSPLYRPLMNFVLAKPAMNLRTVPEFMPLLHSDHVEHIAHRHWILEVLTAGLRAPIDVGLCMEVVAFKLLPSFYSCCLSDVKSKLHIVRCLRSAVGVQYGACCLIRDYSLTSWLHHAILSLNVEDFTLINEMVNLVATLWDSLSQPTEGRQDSEIGRSIPHIENPASKVLHLLRALLCKLSAQSGFDTLDQYLSVLSNVMIILVSEGTSGFTKDNLISLIEVLSSYCPNKREFYDILDLGCDFIEDIPSCSSAPKENKLRLRMRALTVQWVKLNKICIKASVAGVPPLLNDIL